MFSRKLFMLTLAGALGFVFAQSSNAGTLKLNLAYAGYTTNTTPTGLTGAGDLSRLASTALQNSSYRHYFDVYGEFSPAGGTEDFRGVIFDVSYGPGLAPATPAGVTGGTGTKWLANNPASPNAFANTFANNQDGGTAGDLLGLLVLQSDASVAAITQVGESGAETGGGIAYTAGLGSRLGRFAIQFNGPLTQDSSVGVQFQAGPNYSFFNNGVAQPSQATGVTGSVVAIPVPEPGIAGLLFVGVATMGLRRRRTA